MKALKIIGVVFAALGIAIFVFWFGWLRAPAASDVCDNVVRVMAKESGREVPETFVAKCLADFSQKPRFGLMPWVKRVKCVRDAQSSSEIDSCTRR